MQFHWDWIDFTMWHCRCMYNWMIQSPMCPGWQSPGYVWRPERGWSGLQHVSVSGWMPAKMSVCSYPGSGLSPSPEINNEFDWDEVAPQLAPPRLLDSSLVTTIMSGVIASSQHNIYNWRWWDMNGQGSRWLWLGILSSQKFMIGFVWCNPWSCEPLEAYGNIMRVRGMWPNPNMPWSSPNFNTNSSSNKIAKLERKNLLLPSEIGWEHLISLLKSHNNCEDSKKLA